MTLFRLADRLNKTVSEIEALSFGEISEWIAYLHLLEREKS